MSHVHTNFVVVDDTRFIQIFPACVLFGKSTFAPANLYLNNDEINTCLIYKSIALLEGECVWVHTLIKMQGQWHCFFNMGENWIRSLAAKALKVRNCFLMAMTINIISFYILFSFLFCFVPVITLCFPYCDVQGSWDKERLFIAHLFQSNGIFVFWSLSNNICCKYSAYQFQICVLN